MVSGNYSKNHFIDSYSSGYLMEHRVMDYFMWTVASTDSSNLMLIDALEEY